MGRKELRALVREEFPSAQCRRTPKGTVGLAPFRIATADGAVISEGHSKVAAWRSAAEALTVAA